MKIMKMVTTRAGMKGAGVVEAAVLPGAGALGVEGRGETSVNDRLSVGEVCELL